MPTIAPYAKPYFPDDDGLPLVGGLLYTYETGTTTPKTAYKYYNGTAHTNPIVLDARGEPPDNSGIYLDSDIPYTFVLKDSDGNEIWSRDYITSKIGAEQIQGVGVIQVDTIADMKSLTGLANGALVQPAEYYSGDGFRPAVRRFIVDATPPTENGGTVIHDDAGAGYFALDVATECDIKEFGAKVDDATDDYTAIQACLDAADAEGFTPTHSNGIARIGTMLSVPALVKFKGQGTIRKAANIDMIELLNGSCLEGIKLRGTGSTYTGRGVVIGTNGDQDILNCDIVDMDGYCVEYESGVGDVGFRSTIRGGTIYRTTRTNPAIKYPDSETNGDRKVISVDSEGGWLCDFAGCATVLVENCNALNFQFNSASKKVCLQGNRIATTGLDLDVLGMNHSISGNIVAGVIDLNSGTNNSQIGPNWDAGVTDNSGSSTNRVYGQAANITPVWNASGTAPAIGNGSISGRAVREGMNLKIFITIVMGSTTTFGTGVYTFTLPSPYSSYTVKQAVGIARALDSGTNYRIGVVVTSAGTPTFSVYSDAGSGQWSPTVPFTWATNDTILMQIDCEIG